jgi:isopentenyldiphosphate isomerase/intracellular septation protein A
MQKIDLLKKLLPGFLPLIVFVVVDSFLGTKAGIVFAIAFGFVELIFIYLKEHRIDKFIIGDTFLLVAMGGISIILENEIFFKLKPALIELIICVLIGFSAFSGKNLMLKMSQRYMKGIEMNKNVENQFNKSLKILFWLFLIHILLVVYSAWFMSNEAWAFISGVLFYILFGLYMLFEFIRNKHKINKMKNEEWFPLVDEDGRVTGKAPRSVCHSGSMLLHPVVHVHIFNQKGELFLQKRSLEKDIQAGKWDTAVGGHISLYESLEAGLKRETEEELGLKNLDYHYVTKYVWQSEIEKELTYVFCAKQNGEILINQDEIDEGKFWTLDEIKNSSGNGFFTPNLEFELGKYGKLILSKIK